MTAPICSHCDDTHSVYLEERGVTWMCTRCPVPCDRCRSGGTGPFCAKTPCTCECHAPKSGELVTAPVDVSDAMTDLELEAIRKRAMKASRAIAAQPSTGDEWAAADRRALLAELDRLCWREHLLTEGLEEALDEYENAAQYKGEFLAKKHRDAETVARLRELLK